MISKIKLILFYSQGQPFDYGIDLTIQKNLMIQKYISEFDEIILYTPSILKNMGFDNYCNQYDDSGSIKFNYLQKNIGFSKWKPLICKIELLKSNPSDIIVYHDIDCFKYPNYLKFYNVKNTILDIINLCNFDFFFPQEHNQPLHKYCKKTVLYELGNNHPFNINFKQLCVNFIIFKNTPISITLLNEWIQCCLNERWINGVSYIPEEPYFNTHCPEQSILNNIIANWIKSNKFNINPKYPILSIGASRKINNYTKIYDFNYLKYLN